MGTTRRNTREFVDHLRTRVTLSAARPTRPCAKAVPEFDESCHFGLALSEKQIPQFTEGMELLESVGPRRRRAS
jgi:hypothetical protein